MISQRTFVIIVYYQVWVFITITKNVLLQLRLSVAMKRIKMLEFQQDVCLFQAYMAQFSHESRLNKLVSYKHETFLHWHNEWFYTMLPKYGICYTMSDLKL